MNFWRRLSTAARVAKTMLFVWLFAIVASWANACMLESGGESARGTPAHAAALSAGNAYTHGDSHPEDPGRMACLDLCDEEQNTIPKYGTSEVSGQMAAAMIESPFWSRAIFESGFPRQRPLAAAPPPQRPVYIRFLRLAI